MTENLNLSISAHHSAFKGWHVTVCVGLWWCVWKWSVHGKKKKVFNEYFSKNRINICEL